MRLKWRGQKTIQKVLCELTVWGVAMGKGAKDEQYNTL
jgi:hypothetical protein